MFRGLLLGLGACTASSLHVTDFGGAVTLRLAPVAGDGLTVDLTAPGMTAAELDAHLGGEPARAPGCPAPHVDWTLDTATGEPLFGILTMCLPDAPITSTTCGDRATLTVEIEHGTTVPYVVVDPARQEGAGDAMSAFAEIPDPVVEASGALSGTVEFTGDCLGEAVLHTISIEWDFPKHDERTTKSRDEVCCGPPVG